MLASTVQALIDAITTGGINTAAEAVSIWQALKDIFYQTAYTMANTPATNQFTYDLRFKKIGNLVYVDGTIKSQFTVTRGNIAVVTIGNSEYFGKTGHDTFITCIGKESLSNGYLKVVGNTITLVTNIGPGNTIIINQHYETNN